MRTMGSVAESRAALDDIEDPVARESAEAFVTSIEVAVSGALGHITRATEDPDAMTLLLRELGQMRT